MSTIVCPLCHNGFRDSESSCPACGRAFSFKDWPVAEAYSTTGLVPRLTVKWADNSWVPAAAEFAIGRSPGYNGLTLNDPTISGIHAGIFLDGNSWKIRKVKPENNLKINGVDLIDDECELFSGDKITIGISAPLEISIEYVQKTSVNTVTGILESCCADKLDTSEFLRIGSDVNTCKIVIKNIAPCNTIIYYQPSFRSWWIVDCASNGGTKLNGAPVRNAELFDEDKISIAGVAFIFQSNMVVPLAGENAGLAVNLEKLSAATKEGKLLLHNVDLQIKPGEFVGILGPSGCGKSSLIQRLAGLGTFSAGQVTVNGFPYREHEGEIKSMTAYVPQDVALHNDLSLDEEIKSFCRLHIDAAEIKEEKIEKALRKFQLSNERFKRIGDLSGGQKRRVTIMLELLRNPQLFLLDEPTAGLDPATETDIMLYLRRIANQGKTILCSTHILGNLHLFDKLLVLSCGEMVFWGTPGELLKYFQVDSMLELYRLLGNGSKAEQIEIAGQYASRYSGSALHKKYTASTGVRSGLPEVKKSSSLWQQTTGYLYRQLLEFTSFRHLKAKEFIKEFLSSAALIQLIIQPVLIALILKLACASYFYIGPYHKKIFFFSAIAVFWLGLNSAIRELVKERTPWRCLERLEHISIVSYLSSKVIWTLVLSLIQVSVFSVILYGFPCIQTEEVRLAWELNGEFKHSGFVFMPVVSFILFCVCVTGAWTALAISAFFKKENPAVGLLPIILIPVLFFSEPIMLDTNFGNYPPQPVQHIHKSGSDSCAECIRRENDKIKTSNGQYNDTALKIKRMMPCHEPQVLMDLLHSKAEETSSLNAAKWRMIRNTLCYMLLSLVLMIIFQYNNERKWEGR